MSSVKDAAEDMGTRFCLMSAELVHAVSILRLQCKITMTHLLQY